VITLPNHRSIHGSWRGGIKILNTIAKLGMVVVIYDVYYFYK